MPVRKKITSQKSSMKSLDLPTQLHQLMDRQAKESRKTLPHSPHIPMSIARPHTRDTDGEITSNEKFILETTWSTYTTEQFYITRWQITSTDIQQLAWIVYEKIFQKSTPVSYTHLTLPTIA